MKAQSTQFAIPMINRRSFLTGAAAMAAFGRLQHLHAQSLDPWDYMTAMIAKPDFGTPAGTPSPGPIADQGWYWDAYLRMPIKQGQDDHFTCEFDSAWIVGAAYEFDIPLDEQISIVGIDDSMVPYWVETESGFDVYGGDVNNHFCGDLTENILSRARCNAMRRVFESRGLGITITPDRESIAAALLRGEPVYFKSTVDMMPWRQATWYSNTGEEWPVALTNDHALIVMGFNAEAVIIRDPLGPTSTNWDRPWQWRTSWDRFIEVLSAQGNDAIAVAPQPVTATPQG